MLIREEEGEREKGGGEEMQQRQWGMDGGEG